MLTQGEHMGEPDHLGFLGKAIWKQQSCWSQRPVLRPWDLRQAIPENPTSSPLRCCTTPSAANCKGDMGHTWHSTDFALLSLVKRSRKKNLSKHWWAWETIKGMARDKRPRNQDTSYKPCPAQQVWPQVLKEHRAPPGCGRRGFSLQTMWSHRKQDLFNPVFKDTQPAG